MYLLALFVSLEILIGIATALPSSNKSVSNQTSKTNPHILGESDSSDTTAQTPDQTSSDQPTTSNTPEQSQAQGSSNQSPPIGAQTVVGSEQPTEQQPADTPIETPTQQEPQNSPAPNNSSVQIEITGSPDSSQAEINSGLTALDATVFQEVTQESPSDQLSEQTVNVVKQEEEQLQNAKSPEEQADLLVSFETNNIQTLDANIKTNNFDDVAFNAERLSYQIDQSIDTIQQLSGAKSSDFRNKIEAVCKNAEYVLRPEQLLVPEDVEQTLEVSRGKCFNFVK